MNVRAFGETGEGRRCSVILVVRNIMLTLEYRGRAREGNEE